MCTSNPRWMQMKFTAFLGYQYKRLRYETATGFRMCMRLHTHTMGMRRFPFRKPIPYLPYKQRRMAKAENVFVHRVNQRISNSIHLPEFCELFLIRIKKNTHLFSKKKITTQLRWIGISELVFDKFDFKFCIQFQFFFCLIWFMFIWILVWWQ